MKSLRICAALLMAAIAVPAFGQVSVYVGSPPPPVRYERRVAAPGPEYVWQEGYWAPQGRHYRWIQGHWERRPYENAYWTHPHYDHYQEGWRMHEGHWDREDHDNGYWRDHDDHRDRDDHHDRDDRDHDNR